MTDDTAPTRGQAWGRARHLSGRISRLSVVRGGRREPVTDPVMLTVAGLAGGGPTADPDRALTVHPWEHDVALIDAGLPVAAEPADVDRLTTVGLLDSEVFVGDVFRWGDAEVQVSAPVVPDPSVLGAGVAARLRRSGRTGFHLRVLRTGRVDPAGTLDLIDVDPAGVSLATVGLALLDGPTAAGITAERLAMLGGVLPADLAERWGRPTGPADLGTSAAAGVSGG